MKIFWSVIFVIVSFFAQAQKISLGLSQSLDLNLYRFYNSGLISDRYMVLPDYGMTFTPMVRYDFSSHWSIQTGLGLTTKQLIGDLNKMDYIFESINYTSVEIPLRARLKIFSIYEASKESQQDKLKSNVKRRKKNKSRNRIDEEQRKEKWRIDGVFGVAFSKIITAKPLYFTDGDANIDPLPLYIIPYPEVGLSASKTFKNKHNFSLDIMSRVSRNPFEFSTKIVEKIGIEFVYFYRI